MKSMFVTHARTLEELRDEFLSDLRRRIQFLDGQIKTVARSATERARIARATYELEETYNFWSKVTLARAKRQIGRPAGSDIDKAIANGEFPTSHKLIGQNNDEAK